MDVLLDVFGVCAAVYKDLLYAVRGKEFEGILDDWDVDQGEKTLWMGSVIESSIWSICSWGAYPRLIQSEWSESVLEVIGNDHSLEGILSLVIAASLGRLLALTGGTLTTLFGHVDFGYLSGQ